MLASAAVAMLIGGAAGPAGADPAQLTAFIGVGSDTTQDVLNGLAGKSGTTFFTPVQTTSGRQIISFDALNPSNSADICITTKTGAPSIRRPNGSGNGVRALSRSLDGGAWGAGTCGSTAGVSGGLIKVDFARSSAGPTSAETLAGTQLAYVPMARDGIGFAYWAPSGVTPVTTLTRAQLTSIYSGATRQEIDPDGAGPAPAVTIIPCGIQTGSGTFSFWNTAHAGTAESAATVQCNDLDFTTGLGTTVTANGDAGRVQESDAPALKSKGQAFGTANPAVTNYQVIVGFSGAAFIAKTNGLGLPSPVGTGVDMGAVVNPGGTNLGKPYTTVDGKLAPVQSYFDDSTFGRTVYNVLDAASLNDPDLANPLLVELFKDTNAAANVNTSKICQATATITEFGFTVASDCGDSTTTRAGYKPN